MTIIETGHSSELAAQTDENRAFSVWHSALSEADKALYREAMDAKNDSEIADANGTITSLFGGESVRARELKPEHLEILARRKVAIGY